MLLEPKPLLAWVEETEKKPELPWLLTNFIQYDSLVQITGPATIAFKTWFAMTCGLVVASGGMAHGLSAPSKQNVLYLLQEGPAKPSAERFRKLEAGLQIPLSSVPNFYFQHREPFLLNSSQDMDQIATYCLKQEVKLVVIDTLSKVNPGDENSSQDINIALRGMDKIRKKAPGCSIMYLHHTGKPPGEKGPARDIDDESRGSSALAGGYDIHIAFRKRFSEQDHLEVTVRGNQIKEAKYEIEWKIGDVSAHFVLSGVGSGDITTARATELAALLEPGTGYNPTELGDLWKMSPEQAKYLAHKIAQMNLIVQRKRTFYSRDGAPDHTPP